MQRNQWTIAVDWGTSSFRAYLLAPDGDVAARTASDQGILAVRDGAFAAALEAAILPWRTQYPEASIILGGMIGSRQGWREAPYAPCPAGLAELAANLVRLETPRLGPILLVPGVMRRGEDGVPDVMRGEESQLMGLAAPAGEQLVILPGTHSKWALLHDGRIVWFATFMTGELFAVLKAHSILGRLMTDGGDDETGFRRGVMFGLDPAAAHGGLLHRLFSARTLGLAGDLEPAALAPYLSGLLIGSEIAEAQRCATALGYRADAKTVTLVGSATLAGLYARALAHAGWHAIAAGEETAAHGLARIAAAAMGKPA